MNKKLSLLLLTAGLAVAAFAATTPYQPYSGTAPIQPGNPPKPDRRSAVIPTPLILTNLSTSAIGTITLAGTTNAAFDVNSTGSNQLGLFFNVVTPFASTSNVTAVVEFSPDGQHWLTDAAHVQTVVFPLTGTTPVLFLTNFAAANTVNISQARLRSISTTATNAIYFTNVFFFR